MSWRTHRKVRRAVRAAALKRVLAAGVKSFADARREDLRRLKLSRAQREWFFWQFGYQFVIQAALKAHYNTKRLVDQVFNGLPLFRYLRDRGA